MKNANLVIFWGVTLAILMPEQLFAGKHAVQHPARRSVFRQRVKKIRDAQLRARALADRPSSHSKDSFRSMEEFEPGATVDNGDGTGWIKKETGEVFHVKRLDKEHSIWTDQHGIVTDVVMVRRESGRIVTTEVTMTGENAGHVLVQNGASSHCRDNESALNLTCDLLDLLGTPSSNWTSSGFEKIQLSHRLWFPSLRRAVVFPDGGYTRSWDGLNYTAAQWSDGEFGANNKAAFGIVNHRFVAAATQEIEVYATSDFLLNREADFQNSALMTRWRDLGIIVSDVSRTTFDNRTYYGKKIKAPPNTFLEYDRQIKRACIKGFVLYLVRKK